MNCQTFQIEMVDLPVTSPEVSATAFRNEAMRHLEACAACQKEYAALQATFALLDTWDVPNPSPYFDQKMGVLLREEQAKPAAGWLERVRSYLLFSTGRQLRPVLVGTMALAVIIGGGTYAGISALPVQHTNSQVSAAVDDLQILDRNDQALQQMDQLLQDDPSQDDSLTPPPRT